MSISLNNFTCPHCLKENATIFDVAKFNRPLSSGRSIVFACRTCDKSMIIDISLNKYGIDLMTSVGSFVASINGKSILFNGNEAGNVKDIYPTPQTPRVPEYLSDIVSKNMREAKELFAANYFNQSGMTSRRTIDLATKELLPEHAGMLNSRIKQLLGKGVITQQLFDWADIIKLGGNSANHDYDDFTEHEAKQLLDFTEMFLMYVFTLPKMVELKRAEED